MTAERERRLRGARVRDERRRRGWDKPEMARRLGRALTGTRPDPDTLISYIKRWEAGKVGVSERYRMAYVAAFAMESEEELFSEGQTVRADPSTASLDGSMLSEALDLAEWLESTNVGDGTIGYLTNAMKRLTFDYARRPPLEVLADAIEVQRRVSGLLRGGRQRLTQTQALVETASELFALISLLAGDVGQYPAADAFGYTAWTCADETGSNMARALVLSAQSKTARWEGKFTEAAELARRGFELCPPAPERILLAAAEATALQSRGDIEGAWQSMRRAQRARDELGDHDETATAWTCVRPRQAAYALQVGLGAGDPAAMLREVHAADEAWAEGDPWVYGTWAQVRIGAALAHIMQGEPDGAAAELEPVFDLGTEYRVVTIIGRIGEVGRTLSHPRYAGSRPATDLRERIRAFRAGSLEHRAIAAPEAP